MDKGIKVIPEWDAPIIEARATGVDRISVSACGWRSTIKSLGWRDLTKARTYRIRADQIDAVVKLFRVVSEFMTTSQSKRVFINRASALADVPVLDRLVDAGR
jgi:hypothetical protein